MTVELNMENTGLELCESFMLQNTTYLLGSILYVCKRRKVCPASAGFFFFFLVTWLYWFLWDSGCSLLICCDGARYLCLCLFVCPSIKRHFRLKSSLQESVAGFFWMWSCVLLPKLRIKHITLHVCQLIGLIAALNRFNVSPRQCGGFTDNLQLHDAHGEKRLGPLGPAPVLWTQHVKCLRQNSCLFMKTWVGGWERKQRTEITEKATWECEHYFWSCIWGVTKNMVTED